MFFNQYRNRWFRRQRARFRAAQALSSSQDPLRLLAIGCELENIALAEPGVIKADLKKIQPALAGHGEDLLRQIFLAQELWQSIMPALLEAHNGSASLSRMAMPNSWQAVLQKKGNRFRNFDWVYVQFRTCLHNLARTGATLITAWRASPLQINAHPKVLVQNLPSTNTEGSTAQQKLGFVSSLRSAGVLKDGLVWSHIIGACKRQPHPVTTASIVSGTSFPMSYNKLGCVSLTLFALRLFVWGLVGLIGKKWWRPFLVYELFLAACYDQSDAVGDVKTVVFHNSDYILRPAWSYLAESQGADVWLAFYSTNIETFSISPEHPRPQYPGFTGMTWPAYAVWDIYQKDFLVHTGVDRGRIRIVGPISISGNAERLPAIPESSIAVFDISPHRPSELAARGLVHPYFQTKNAIKFLEHIHDAMRARGGTMLIKQKREMGKSAAGPYQKFMRNLAKEPDVLFIAPSFDACQLIDQVDAVISYPFTSTAILGQLAGKPSAFYDPLGVWGGEARLSHGIEVIASERALSDWIGRALSDSTSNRSII